MALTALATGAVGALLIFSSSAAEAPAIQTRATDLAPVQVLQSEQIRSAAIPDEPERLPIGLSTPIPTATPRPTQRPTRTAQPQLASRGTSHSIAGTATWYCLPGRSRCSRGFPGGLYAAISPDLQFLRGRDVRVCSEASCVVVTVIDCNCQATRSVDLYADAFVVISPLSAGRINVRISW